MKLKICTKCGVEKSILEFYKNLSKKEGIESCCKNCTKIRVKKYELKVPEKVKYWKTKNKELNTKRAKIYYQKNKQKIIERSKLRGVNKKEEIYNWYKIYYIKNKLQFFNRAKKRRELKKIYEFNWKPENEEFIRNKFNNMCFKCGISQNKINKKLHIDHHYPLNKGFGLSLDNTVLLCQSCNNKKGIKDPTEFYTDQEIFILRLGGTKLDV